MPLLLFMALCASCVPKMSPPSNSLADLAAQISHATEQVNAFLAANGHPQPSFDRDAPSAFPEAPAAIQAARQQILDACQTMYDALVGPAEHLRWMACRVCLNQLQIGGGKIRNKINKKGDRQRQTDLPPP